MATISTADLTALKRAIQLYQRVSRRTEEEIVNGVLKDVAYRAAQYTPKAPSGAVIALSLQQNGLLPALAAESLNRKLGKNPRKGAKVWGRAEHKKEMTIILKRARSGVNAIRAGWGKVVVSLGGEFRGFKASSGRSASNSSAKKATISNLSGFIINAVRDFDRHGKLYGAGDIGVARQALREAIASVTIDKLKEAQKRMSAILRSARNT